MTQLILMSHCRHLTTTLRIILSAVVLAAMLPTSSATAQEPQFDGFYLWEIVPCPVAPALKNEIEGLTYDCGIVTVPENYDKPVGRSIELVYLRLRSTGATPAPDPLIYLSGGPGGSGTYEFSVFEILTQNMQATRQSRDIIVYDQRGTGYSGRLNCGPFQTALGIVAEERPDLAPSIEKLSAGIAQQALGFGACASGYKAKGLDLSQYNSVSSAKDIQALALTLGYTSGYNLYGTSYGTRLALNAARTTPETVRSVVLDGVVGPQFRGSAFTSVKLYEQYQNIFLQCAADERCNDGYPNIEQRFITLLRGLKSQPLAVNPPIRTREIFAPILGQSIESITPDFFVNLSDINNGSSRGGFAAMVPRMILEIERGETTLLRSLLADTSPAATTGDPIDQIRPGEAVIVPDQAYFAAPIQVLLERAEAAAKPPSSPADRWVARAIGDLRERLLAGESQTDVITAFVQLTVLPTEGPRPEALIAFAENWLSPKAAAELDTLVKDMSRHDARQTMWGISDIAGVMGGSDERALSAGMMLSVNCSEEMAFTIKDDVQQFIDSAPYPGLIRYNADDFEALFLLACRLFPKTVNDTSVMNPVLSDIPALLFVESMDIQTPRSLGLKTRETLTNSFLVEWHSEGHVIASRSPDGCAGSIAADFLAAPTSAPDATCSRGAYYQLSFLMPDAPWPPPAHP